MVRREVVLVRLDKLKEYMKTIEEISLSSKEEYIKNPLLYGSCERFLHLAIECILDIGNHIITDQGYRKPDNNRDIFEVLNENSVINNDLKENLCNMASFRNILVHDYLNLNRGMVYNIIKNNMDDIRKFVAIIADYI
ncbi:type VII toxin-antitoxin system HepT family RNase toxin [Clostridium sp. DL1XJH146]